MSEFLNAKELSALTGMSMRKAGDAIRKVNKTITEQGGMTVKGKAPRDQLAKLLFCDLSKKNEAEA